jgi:hypothetical protein
MHIFGLSNFDKTLFLISSLLVILMTCNVFGGSCTLSCDTEGFLNGAPLNYKLTSGVPNDYWGDTSAPSGAACQDIYAKLANNVGGPVPPKGLFMFADNVFKPECCLIPQQFSSSSGCACLSKEQMQYISSRGGNNTSPDF